MDILSRLEILSVQLVQNATIKPLTFGTWDKSSVNEWKKDCLVGVFQLTY